MKVSPEVIKEFSPTKTQNRMLLPANKQNELTVLKTCSQTQPVATIELAIKAQTECLSGLKKKSPAETVTIVAYMIERFLHFLQVSNTMTEQQRNDTAKLIINEFYWLKLEDLDLFFRRFRTGFYGDLFNRIDGLVIMAKLREYCSEREDKAQLLTLQAHKEVDKPIADKVLIKAERGFIRANGCEYEEVEKKEDATEYEYAVALKIVAKIEAAPNELKIIPAKSFAEGFFNHMMKTEPEKLHPANRFKIIAEKYAADKKAIESSNLSEFEKHNAILALSGVAPKTQQEYDQYILSLAKPNL